MNWRFWKREPPRYEIIAAESDGWTCRARVRIDQKARRWPWPRRGRATVDWLKFNELESGNGVYSYPPSLVFDGQRFYFEKGGAQ